jgi:hypothetical protein
MLDVMPPYSSLEQLLQILQMALLVVTKIQICGID